MEFNPICFTTPDFFDCREINAFHKENKKSDNFSVTKNYHCLARARYNHENGEKAIIAITADDYYKLYINGAYVCEGPSQSFYDNYYYNEIDISQYLVEGENIIAVHLYYHGLINRAWVSGDNRFFICAMINGDNLFWKYSVSSAFSGIASGYDTDFTECFDSRFWNNAWNTKGFDDSEWSQMLERKYSVNFVKQPTQLIEVTKIPCEAVLRDGRYFIDIGYEICGGIRLECCGQSGDNVRIRYAEELNPDGTLKYNLRANCEYYEEWLLDDGYCTFESYIYKGFRYLEIEPDVEMLNVDVICRHYPFDDDYCKPRFSDNRLEGIFTLCKDTIKYATQESFIDCPTREKGQYLGDAFISAHSHILLTGRTELAEKCVKDFAMTSKICGGLMAVAPCSFMQEIADYSLLFGELVLMVYGFNHDPDFLSRYYSTAKNIILHFKQFEREDGLLDCVSDKWNLVDWPENLRDDYDFNLSRPVVAQGAHNVINAYYIGAVKTLNEIEDILGLEKSFDLEALKKSYINAFFRNGLFVDSEISEHTSLHSNTLALYFDLVPFESKDTVADFIVSKGFSCGVFFSYFVMKALAFAGRKSELFNLLVNDGEHGWLNMLREGATTCFEAWGREQKFNTSLCHPWATAPISIILEELKDYVISFND